MAKSRPFLSELVSAASIGLVSFAILLLTMPRDLGIYDESVILVGAMRLLDGDVIHRDFYANYGPGQFYCVALLFWAFGKSFIAARIYDLVIRAGVIATLFYIIRRQCSLFIALVFTAMGAMWLMGIGFYLYPVFPCILLSLIGSYFLLGMGGGSDAVPTTIVGGLCTGLTALFRYDIGFLLLISHIVSIVTLHTLSRPRETRIWRTLVAITAYGGGVAVMFVPVAIAFLLASPINAFFVDIVDYATKYYAVMRGLPFPGLVAIWANPFAAVVYLPLLAVGLALIQLVPLVRRNLEGTLPQSLVDHSREYLVVFGIDACFFFTKGVVRVSEIHMLLAIVPSLVVFAVLANIQLARRNSMPFATAILLFLLSLFPARSAAGQLYRDIRVTDGSIAGWLAIRSGLIAPPVRNAGSCETGPASGIAKLAPEYARVATYLSAHTKPDERILIALNRHDKVFVNPVGLYFATGRLPGTHWHHFDPGIQTRADIQMQILNDLQRNKVRWVVRDASFETANEPNGSALSSGVILLDQFLDENYRSVASSGSVTIWLANQEEPIVEHEIGNCQVTPVQPLREGR
jgi:hypothetical protein